MSAGRTNDRLQRIERAGSKIAVNNPECSERRRRRGLARDARQRRIVVVNEVGRHDRVSLARLVPHAVCRAQGFAAGLGRSRRRRGGRH